MKQDTVTGPYNLFSVQMVVVVFYPYCQYGKRHKPVFPPSGPRRWIKANLQDVVIGLINWKRSSRMFVNQPCLLAGKGRSAQSWQRFNTSSAWSLYCDLVFMKVCIRVWGLTWGLSLFPLWYETKRNSPAPPATRWALLRKDNRERCHTPFHAHFKRCEVPCFSLHRQCAGSAFTCQRAAYISVLCIHSWYGVESNINPLNERAANRQCTLATSLGAKLQNRTIGLQPQTLLAQG